MKRQIRFRTEAEILKAIDECHERSKQLMREAEFLEEQAQAFFAESAKLFEAGNLDYAAGAKNQGRDAKKRSMKLRKTATRLIDVKAKKLGRALAAFQTSTFRFVGKDKSVVLV